jgi:hypothetical protein
VRKPDELADIDKQLDEIEQSKRRRSAIWGSTRRLAPYCPIALLQLEKMSPDGG